jgi:heme-degrading monooxygenase HmoA
MRPLSRFRLTRICVKFGMITRIWHGRTPAAKSDEYFQLMRTVAIPDYRAIPGNTGAYALRRIEGDIAHFLMVTFWESEDAIRTFAGDTLTVAKYYDFDKNFLLEMEPASTHYETYDR